MILGGAQEDVLLTVDGLRRSGRYEVGIVSGPETGSEGELLSQARGLGVPVRIVPELVRAVRPGMDLAALAALRRLFSELRPDIVQTHSSKAGIVGRLAARLARVPVVIHRIHGLAFHPYGRWWRNRLYVALERAAAPLADRLVSVSEVVTRQALAAGVGSPEQYTTIYSGVNVRPYLEAGPKLGRRTRQRYGLGEGDLVIVKVARLFELKGHEYVLAAAPRVLEALPNARFLFVGGGPLRATLERWAADLLPPGTVRFTGLVPPGDIPGLLAASDILVHASLREGLPRVFMQAMLAARPVVSFDVDGAPEIVSPGENGELIRPGDTGALARAIVTIGRDAGLRARMGRAGRERCRETFSAEALLRSTESLYRQLLG